MRTQKKKNASGGNIEYPSDAFSNSKSLKLEQQMGNRADDCQGNNGSLQEDEEQFEQVDRQLGAENQSAYFVQVTETTATMNRVIGTALVPAMMTDGVNISVKPTTMVEAAAATSGTCRALRSGRNGMPSQSKTGV